MTEKRFENRLNKDNIKFNTLNPVWDNEKETAWNVFEMIDLMNELHDENKQLKNKLQTYKTSNSLLKATMDRHRTENQQIRDTINEMYENERTELGRSVLKQLLDSLE